MRKDKEIYTITVPCNGQEHQISLTKEGKLILLNHADDEIETELALEKLGGELPECLKIKKAWESNVWRSDFYYYEQRDDDSILDDALTYLDFAYKSRNSFREKILGLIGIFVAGLVISVIISLIQQTFNLFWIYTCASANVIFGLYYVLLSLDSSSGFGAFFMYLIIVGETVFYLGSLYDFKIFNIVLLLIFILLYIVPIMFNKVFLKVASKIEED